MLHVNIKFDYFFLVANFYTTKIDLLTKLNYKTKKTKFYVSAIYRKTKNTFNVFFNLHDKSEEIEIKKELIFYR
jgi:hypothetical protein